MWSLLLLLACARTPPDAGLLVVTIDTWRADHLDATLTPEAMALAARGLTFERAYSPIGLTTPAHASLFTGLLPPRHGLRGNNHHGYALAPEHGTLAERLAAAGWDTAAFVSAWPAGPEGGLDQGFDRFSGPDAGERGGELAVGEAMAWIAARRGPWFAWVHVYEPHGPYAPPLADLRAVGGEGRGDRGAYAGEVHAADRLVGPLLRSALDRGAWVLLSADHGEVLDEEPCGWQHERSSSAEVLRVPMILAGPGLPRGERRQGLVGLTDPMPTLLRLAGQPVPEGLDGWDLLLGPAREVWVAESGLCEPACAPGCAPPGFPGKDRVVIAADGRRLVSRPGRGALGDAALLPWLEGWPAVQDDPTDPDLAHKVQGLGYVEPASVRQP